MLKLTRTLAAVSAVLLCAAAAPAPGRGANPIVNGHGEWDVPGATIGFQVSVREMPDGSIRGHGSSTRSSDTEFGWVHFDVTDYLFVGDELAVAGLITSTFNTPPEFLGTQVVLLIQDNGNGAAPPDKAISGIGIPPFLTLEEIVNAPPPNGPPPPEAWFPLAAGNFRIH